MIFQFFWQKIAKMLSYPLIHTHQKGRRGRARPHNARDFGGGQMWIKCG